jgi:hypothetical protein
MAFFQLEVGRACIFQAWVVTFGLVLLGLFNLKIGPGAFKIWALITGLKIYEIYEILLKRLAKKFPPLRA